MSAGKDRARADDEIRARWPAEWRDGARCAFLETFEGEREKGGYPKNFHAWPLDRSERLVRRVRQRVSRPAAPQPIGEGLMDGPDSSSTSAPKKGARQRRSRAPNMGQTANAPVGEE